MNLQLLILGIKERLKVAHWKEVCENKVHLNPVRLHHCLMPTTHALFHVLKVITGSERYSVGGDKPKGFKTYKAQKFNVISCYNSLDVV
jgi:hypothetical protein